MTETDSLLHVSERFEGVAAEPAAASARLASRPFMVLTTQRTGSSWVMDRINHQPSAQGHMELFYHDVRRKPARAGCNDYPRFVEIGDTLGSGRRPKAVFEYLDRLYGRPGAVGFKLMYSQLRQYPEILWYLLRHRLPLVHLVRDNHLDIIISEELARVTGTSHATVEDGAGETPVFEFEPQSIVARVRRLDRKQRFFRRLLRVLPNPVHETAYEALCENDNVAFASLYRFIGAAAVDDARAESSLVKRQRASHREVIGNYDEVAAALTRAGYGHLLH